MRYDGGRIRAELVDGKWVVRQMLDYLSFESLEGPLFEVMAGLDKRRAEWEMVYLQGPVNTERTCDPSGGPEAVKYTSLQLQLRVEEGDGYRGYDGFELWGERDPTPSEVKFLNDMADRRKETQKSERLRQYEALKAEFGE